MVQQDSGADKVDVSTQGAELKSDAQVALKMQEFLRRYTPATTEVRRDVLQERYRIEISSPLPEFDGRNVRAYAATDLSQPGKSLFAHVCPLSSVQRHRAINALKPISHQYILPMIAAGPVELSRPEEERFVLFYERPAGKRISALAAQNKGAFNQNFICDRIIAPLASAINQFSELDISHGMINPDNVYFTDVAILGPCLSEPCGLTQPFWCEPLERMQALPIGKGEGSTAQDYYALAVLVLYILHGADHFADLTPESLSRDILKEGIYNAITRQKEIPEMFYDFFRGMLCLNAGDRWNYRYVKPWLEGRRYNVLSPPAPMEAIRPFEFGDAQANSRRELVNLFSADWDKIAEPVQNGKLTQWITISLRNKELADSVTRISRTVSELGNKSDVQLGEQLMRILLLLDPEGPLRIRQLSFHLDGLDALSLESYMAKSQQELQFLAKFIEFNMASYWLELQRKEPEYVVPTATNVMLIRLERLRTYIRNAGLGFGVERIIYDLNPDLPCLSPLFASACVTTLPDLLRRIDRLAATMSKQDDPIDRHIAAYIASKLNIQHEIRLHDLAAIPSLANNRTLITLYILSMAQQKAGNIPLPGLTHWLGLRILPLLEIIHSRTLRQSLKAQLLEQAQSGYTQLLAEVMINADFASADQAGFYKAWNSYQASAIEIENYRGGKLIDLSSARLGFSIAKMFAYVALMFSLFTSLRDIHL